MAGRTLAATVFVTAPKTHETLLLTAGTEVTDPAIEDQITHPDAWAPEPAHAADTQPPRSSRRTKTVTETS